MGPFLHCITFKVQLAEISRFTPSNARDMMPPSGYAIP